MEVRNALQLTKQWWMMYGPNEGSHAWLDSAATQMPKDGN
jgi:hypothetical protein